MSRTSRHSRVAVLAALVLGLTVTGWATRGPSRPPAAFVLASASLGPVLQALLPELQSAVGGRVRLEVAGTPTLLAQLRAGVPGDLLLSADEQTAASLVADGLALAPVTLVAYNRLAVITAAGNPRRLHTLADLEKHGLVVALAGPQVPAGRYARAAFAAAHLPVPRAATEPSVDGVLTAVRTGGADAGVVYGTDARRAAPGVTRLPLDLGIRTTCVAVALSSGDRRVGAALMAVLRGAVARRLLAADGFELA